MSVRSFDFLGLETKMVGAKIRARATGPLGPMFQPFVDDYFRRLNSLKVIAKVDGANAYNLYNPPQPTPAGMRHLMRRVKRMLYGIVFPGTANLAVTGKCQCRCVHCSAEPFRNPNREELTTEEIKRVVDGALDLGASLVIFVGGEPLIRDDIYELISYVDKEKAIVMIFTNGLLLTDENVKSLKRAGLATLNISIDSPNPETHNELRGVPALFNKAFEGAARCREQGILTGISTYATSERLRSGEVEKLLQIAQKEGFHEVTIFDCIPSGKFLKRSELILTDDEKRQVSELAKRYHEMDHPMGVVAQSIVNSPDRGGCFGAYSQFYMTAYGDINPCDFNPISFGNVREMPVQAIWKKMLSHPDFAKHELTCRMQDKEYRRKYIDPLPDDPQLPIPIEQYPMT